MAMNDTQSHASMALPYSYCVVAAVNNEQILEEDLLRSPMIERGDVRCHGYRGFSNISAAYNRGLEDTEAEIVIFAHQDVYFPAPWLDQLKREVMRLDLEAPDWAVIGLSGIDSAKEVQGHVWATGLGREIIGSSTSSQSIVSVDELAIILKRRSGLRYDEQLPSFHMYGTDLVTAARVRGHSVHVISAPVIHNSNPYHNLFGGYEQAYRYLQKKWSAQLPIPTLNGPLRHDLWALRRTQFRALKKRIKGDPKLQHIRHDVKAIAQRLGYESDVTATAK